MPAHASSDQRQPQAATLQNNTLPMPAASIGKCYGKPGFRQTGFRGSVQSRRQDTACESLKRPKFARTTSCFQGRRPNREKFLFQFPGLFKTTIPFHLQLMQNDDFRSGNFTTKFLESFTMK